MTKPTATITAKLTVRLVNRQRRDPVPLAGLSRLAVCAVKRLGIRARGRIMVSFVDARTMRMLNRRFLKHAGLTDVLTFRYHDEPVAGDILIAPAFARRYAAQQRVSYRAELARYVVHGLLHWVGYEDRTATQQRKMRALEDRLLNSRDQMNCIPISSTVHCRESTVDHGPWTVDGS